MGCELQAISDIDLFESGDGVLGHVDCLENILLVVLVFRRIVRLMPRLLQGDKHILDCPCLPRVFSVK